MSSPLAGIGRCSAALGASLRVRNYRLYFFGQSVSVAGSFMQTLAIAFLTLHLTGSGTTSESCVRDRKPRHDAHRRDSADAAGRGQIRGGFRYAIQTPELALPLLMLTVTVTVILTYEFPTTLPLLATGAFHVTAATYEVTAAVMAADAIVRRAHRSWPHRHGP